MSALIDRLRAAIDMVGAALAGKLIS